MYILIFDSIHIHTIMTVEQLYLVERRNKNRVSPIECGIFRANFVNATPL